MKKLFIVLLVVLIALPAFSQIKFGIKVGATTATVPSYDFTSGSNNIEAVKNASWGFQAGAFMRLGIKVIYLQPEVVFATNTYEFNVTTVTATEALKQSFNRLEIPVLLGVKLGPLHIKAGPSATVLIGSPKALLDDPNFADMYKTATFGYQAGIGIDLLKKIALEARYGGNLSKFGDSVSIGGQTFNLDNRQSTFTLSVGLMF